MGSVGAIGRERGALGYVTVLDGAGFSLSHSTHMNSSGRAQEPFGMWSAQRFEPGIARKLEQVMVRLESEGARGGKGGAPSKWGMHRK